MSTGTSIHLGLNRIDPGHYGTEGALNGCVNDAQSMQEIAQKAGFKTTLLLNEEANSKQLFGLLDKAERELKSGDTLLITYAGHGSQVPDLNHDEKLDDKDETWCAFDRMIVDDELAEAWSRFRAGVRIVVVSDGCHSATIAREMAKISLKTERADKRNLLAMKRGPLLGDGSGGTPILAYRALPEEFAAEANEKHRDFYAQIQTVTRGVENTPIAASVITLAACQDEQTAGDAADHGLFTRNLLKTWKDGKFAGGYEDFLNEIRGITMGQTPNYDVKGASNEPFEREKPFTILGPIGAEKEGGAMSAKDIIVDLDRELDIVKKRNGNGSRQTFDTSRQTFDTSNGSGPDWARMELFVPRQFVVDASNDDIFKFFETDGRDVLMKAVLGGRKISVPQGVRGEISCGVDHEGHVECHATIHF
jgi:hypothetical protein